jgi:hypothetical protein
MPSGLFRTTDQSVQVEYDKVSIPISIVFGSSVSGAEGSTSNDVEASLAYNTVDQRACAVLGPRLGKRLNAIFREASAQ